MLGKKGKALLGMQDTVPAQHANSGIPPVRAGPGQTEGGRKDTKLCLKKVVVSDILLGSVQEG